MFAFTLLHLLWGNFFCIKYRDREDKIIQEDICHRIDFNFAFELGITSIFSHTEFYTEIDNSYLNALSWVSW